MITPEPGTARTVAGRALPANGAMPEPRDLSTAAIPGPAAGATAEPGRPIACDMTDAPDTWGQRLAEYTRLFETAYVGRDHDQSGARWLLRAGPGIEEWARDLASRENACCAFMTSTVTRQGDLVIWHMATTGEAAKAVLEVFHDLPLNRWRRASEVEDAFDRWSTAGVPIIMREGDVSRPATAEEIRDGHR